MKRLAILTLSLAMLLAGCGQSNAPAQETDTPDTQQETPVETGPQETPAQDGQADAGREPAGTIAFTVEGETEEVPATLYTGGGWSLYIPDEGWTATEGDGAVAWASNDNEAVNFAVVTVPGMTPEEAMADFTADGEFVYEDLVGGRQGNPLLGSSDDGLTQSMEYVEGADAVYLLVSIYPAEAAEGFGARMSQILATFALDA